MATNNEDKGGLAPGFEEEEPVLLASGLGDAGDSVLAFIGVSFGMLGNQFVNHRLADSILFAGPIAEIQQTAALAAEWEVRGGFGVGRFAANRAPPPHAQRIPQTAIPTNFAGVWRAVRFVL